MRIILLAIVALIGLNIASQSIDKVDKIQQERMQQYCQIDPTMCNQSWKTIQVQSIRTSMKKSS